MGQKLEEIMLSICQEPTENIILHVTLCIIYIHFALICFYEGRITVPPLAPPIPFHREINFVVIIYNLIFDRLVQPEKK